jgi:hypothetical protein
MHADSSALEHFREEWLGRQCDMRSHSRHPLFEPLIAWLQMSTAGASPIRADVIDRSQGGLCLAVASPCVLQPGEILRLTIHAGPELELRHVRVCWREETALIVALGVAYDDS